MCIEVAATKFLPWNVIYHVKNSKMVFITMAIIDFEIKPKF